MYFFAVLALGMRNCNRIGLNCLVDTTGYSDGTAPPGLLALGQIDP